MAEKHNQNDVSNSREKAWNYSILFNRLCSLDELDKRNNLEPQWVNITDLGDDLKAFNNATDAAYLAEAILLDIQYIERDPYTNNVRLTKRGRDNCQNSIEISPTNVEKLIEKYGGFGTLRHQLLQTE
jgi:hypothetical protein